MVDGMEQNQEEIRGLATQRRKLQRPLRTIERSCIADISTRSQVQLSSWSRLTAGTGPVAASDGTSKRLGAMARGKGWAVTTYKLLMLSGREGKGELRGRLNPLMVFIRGRRLTFDQWLTLTQSGTATKFESEPQD